MWLRSTLLPAIGFVSMLILSVLISGIYPAIVQQLTVKPNASDKEAPYIRRNIEATRQAYNIVTDTKTEAGAVTYKTYPVTSTPSATSLAPGNATIDNIRILDPNVVSPTFVQKQKVRNPYGFAPTLDMDRYTLKDPNTKTDVEHDYVVGVREMVSTNLTGSLANWINAHTVYTHGYGFVAAQADDDITNGTPGDFTEGDIPPAGPIAITQPQV